MHQIADSHRNCQPQACWQSDSELKRSPEGINAFSNLKNIHTLFCVCTLQARCDEQQVGIDRDTGSTALLQKQIEQLEEGISEGEAASKKRKDLIEHRLRDIAANNQKINSMMACRGSQPLKGNTLTKLLMCPANMFPKIACCTPM